MCCLVWFGLDCFPIRGHWSDPSTKSKHDHTTQTQSEREHAIQQHLDLCRARKKPLTSPKTGVELSEAQAGLAPVVMVRGQVSDYKAAKQQEWEAAEQAWRAWAEGQGEGM